MPSLCPTDVELVALLTGDVSRAELEQHLEHCATCRHRLDSLVVGDGNWLGDARRYLKVESEAPEKKVAAKNNPFEKATHSTVDITIVAQKVSPTARQGIQHLGDYEILSELGRGGMGVVFKARQRSLQRDVALKVILAGQLASEAEVRRFHVEAEAAAKLDHPNIVPTYEIGAHEGRHYFSMKLVEGLSLKERRSDFQALQPGSDSSFGERMGRERKLARLLAIIARAVHHAHERGILHRDLKPANVLMDNSGQPHLTDFGLAKLLQSNSDLTLSKAVMGTPEYMSPEQAAGKNRMITTASDIYSLGAMLYELLTGAPPFHGEDLMLVLNQVVHEPAKSPRTLNPTLSRDLATICLKCLEKEPSRRPRTAQDLAEELERFERGEPIRARPVNTLERAWRWCRRKPALASALSGLVVMFMVGFALVVWKWRGEIQQNRLAQQQTQRANGALANLDIEKSLQAGNTSRGLAALARLVRNQPTNRVVVERLLNALTYRNVCLPLAPISHGRAIQTIQTRKDHPEIIRASRGPLIHAVNFSPDGHLFVTASGDGTARVWNSLTGQPIGAPLKHDHRVIWANFSPDSTRIVTASRDGFVKVWDAQSQKLVASTARQNGPVWFAAFSPDGTRIVTAGDREGVRLWDAKNAQPLGEAPNDSGPPFYASFNRNGSRILIANRKGPGFVWDVFGDPPAKIDHFFRPESANPFPLFSPTGDEILGFNESDGLLYPANFTPGKEWAPRKLHHDDAVIALAFSGDGSHVATGSHDSTARIWDTKTGLQTIPALTHEQSVVSVNFSQDGSKLLTASSDGTARLWDASNGRPLAEPLRHEGAVLRAIFSPNSRQIVTTSEFDSAWLWSVPTNKTLQFIGQDSSYVDFARFSPDGKMIASLTPRAVLRRDAETGAVMGSPLKPVNPRNLDLKITDLDFSPNGKYLATAIDNGHVLIWSTISTNTGSRPLLNLSRTPKGLDPLELKSFATRRVRFNGDSTELVAASADGSVEIWSMVSRDPVVSLRHQKRVNYAEFSSDGRHIVTASWDNTARKWNARTGAAATPPLRHDNPVNWARFDPSGKKIVTASRDKTVRIWSSETGQELNRFVHADALAESHSFDFSPDGRRLVTIAGETLQVWDMDQGQIIMGPVRQTASLSSVRFSPDGIRIVTAANNNMAYIWDAQTGYQLSEPLEHSGRVTYAEFSPDGSRLLTSSRDKTVRIWPVMPLPVVPAPPWLADLAEALAGQRIKADNVTEAVLVQDLYNLSSALRTDVNPGYYARWARWFAAENRSSQDFPLAGSQ
jgi:eukaryotic-like serine/threonine-protein kinase